MISQIRKLIQDKLISGINIKTINGADILGSGDLTVTGSGVSDGDYGDITVSSSGATWTIDNDTVGLDELSATGTPTASNFLRGDNTWATPTASVADGDKGDITVSSSGTVWNIDAATVGVTELSATGTPSATTFLRGDNTWATPTAADPAGWTTIVKSADQDVTNNATLQNDTDLQFSVVAGGKYMVEMDISTAGNSTAADYKFGFVVSAGTMKLRGLALLITSGGTMGNSLIAAAGTATTTAVASAILNNDFEYLQPMTFAIQFTASSNATFSYQFAQNSASAGVSARTMKGSILKYKKIN
jgi:hypothetical protein